MMATREDRARMFITSLGPTYFPTIKAGLDWIGAASRLKSNDRVAIKPNLTFPVFRKGVMTNPEALEAVILYLREFTNRITICESDSGGYNRFSMDEVFARTGISDFAKRHDVNVVNLSYQPSRPIHIKAGVRKLVVPLPTLVLDETDLFVTMPVPKVHANAIVSLALKNQWGVIQEPAQRLKLHPYFNEVIYGINRLLPRAIAIYDGKYGLNRNGPMRGEEVALNWLLVSDNLFLGDSVVAELMGFRWRKVPHIRYALKRERIGSLGGVTFNCNYRDFMTTPFYLRRDWTDYPGVVTFNSRFMAYLGYESLLARPLHWLLYKFREPFY